MNCANSNVLHIFIEQLGLQQLLSIDVNMQRLKNAAVWGKHGTNAEPIAGLQSIWV